MSKKKGQALIEFIIILPIFIFLILGIIDIGKIIMVKNQLENDMDLIISTYQNVQNLDEIKEKIEKQKEKVEVKEEHNFTQFVLKKETEIITPGLNLILKNPYEITIERTINNES